MTTPWYTVATYTPTVGDRYWCRFITHGRAVMGVCEYLGDNMWESKLLNDEGEGEWITFHIPTMEFQTINWTPKGGWIPIEELKRQGN